jgi:tyrosine-protein kinase Etk/Wzc
MFELTTGLAHIEAGSDMDSYIRQSTITALPMKRDGLVDLWRSTVRHKWMFAIITCGCVFAGGLYTLLATPQYRAEALLRVQGKMGAPISALSDVSGTMATDPSASDESDVLTSRSIVSEAIAQTGAEMSVRTGSYFPLIGQFLAARHASDSELAPPLFGLSGNAWGGEVLKPGVFDVPASTYGDKYRVVAGDHGNWTLFDHTGARIAQGATGETVAFQVATPAGNEAGHVRIDTLRARPGVEFTVSRQSEQMTYDNVIAKLKTAISARDSSIRDPSMIRLSYQADSPTNAQAMINTIIRTYLNRDIEFRAHQAQLNLDFLRARLPGLKTDLEKAENALNEFRTATRSIDLDQQGAALIGRLSALQEHETQLELAFTDAQQRYRPYSPLYQVALSQLNQVRRDVDQTSAAAAMLPSTQREYVRLSRQVAVATTLFTNVLTNSQQLEVAAASTAPGVSVVDWAVSPEKQSWPKKGIVLLGSLLGGLFLSAVRVHLVSLKRKELRTPEEIDYISQLPRLAVVAQSSAQLRQLIHSRGGHGARARLLAITSPTDPSIEALRSLRSILRALSAGGGIEGASKGKVILFTGPTKGVGKSFVSSNFAHLLAETNASVLLVDADMRKGRLSQLVGSRSKAGLADVLEGKVRIEDAIVNLEGSKLSLLDAGTSTPENPSELLGRSAFQDMLTTQRARYDFVVIDSPPILPVSDALAIAAQDCDLVVLVSRADYTGARQLEETLRRLENVGAKVAGHVFNGFLPKRYGEYDEYCLKVVRH